MNVFTHNRHKHTDYTVHYICILQTVMFDVDTVDVFRRPEGKFKKKQSPRDEALQILKPQMDNPPAPQVHTHKHTQLYLQNARILSHNDMDTHMRQSHESVM